MVPKCPKANDQDIGIGKPLTTKRFKEEQIVGLQWQAELKTKTIAILTRERGFSQKLVPRLETQVRRN